MKEIVEYINQYFRENQDSPSIRHISEKFKFAKSSVQRYLLSMDEMGLLSYSGGKIQTEFTEKFEKGCNYSPKVGAITCGNPNEEEPMVEEYINLPQSIFGNGNYYVLTAKGDSMVDEGIEPGDTLVIETKQTANTNDIVVALDSENQNTLKKYIGFNKKSKKYELRYCNEAVYPGKIISVDSLTVQGVLRYVVKQK